MNNKSNIIFMGIDVSKANLDISLSGAYSRIINNSKSIINFIKSNITSDSKEVFCALESTGGYERLAIKLLNEYGIKVHRAHPNKVHAFAKASGHFAKTDKLDAKLLERYADFTYGRVRTHSLKPEVLEELCSLRSLERSLEKELHAYQCRLKHLIGKAKKFADQHIKNLQNKIESVSRAIEEAIHSDQELKDKQRLLMSYKGVGKKVANSLISDLPELGMLQRKKIAGLVGVAPKTNESGQREYQARIFGGRFYVRKALYMSALVAVRHNSRMKLFYEGFIKRGKAPKVALVAIMRKIIITLNSMLKYNKFYS